MELMLAVILVAVYFLPAIVAVIRRHHQGTAIFFLDFLLGWTLLGWVAAFVWSVTATAAAPPSVYDETGTLAAADVATKICPDCAETVRAAARICRFCQHDFEADISADAAR
jgi:hypothetical protein